MGIKDIAPETPKKIMGADCSTNSLGFSIFDEGELVEWGEIKFIGKTVFHRLADAQRKIAALDHALGVDMVHFESAVYVQNKKTVIMLAYAYGAIMGALIAAGAKDVSETSPLVWQRAIGNPPLTREQKAAIDKLYPDAKKSYLSNKYREFRKDRTRRWVKTRFGIDVESDNVTDAIAIGAVAAGAV
jgi:Holliday junction resolvasome RuvABC endonuclease subunit